METKETEYVKLFARISKPLKIELDVHCALNNRKMHEVVTEAVEQFLEAEKQAK